jgi:hypothetical protein
MYTEEKLPIDESDENKELKNAPVSLHFASNRNFFLAKPAHPIREGDVLPLLSHHSSFRKMARLLTVLFLTIVQRIPDPEVEL